MIGKELSLNVPIIKVVVEREKFISSDAHGKPIGEVEESKIFESGDEAIKWIQERPDSEHSISLALPFAVEANVEGESPSTQILIVKIGNREGRLPRSIEGHHSASVDPFLNYVITININVGERSDPVFDRGLAWISPRDKSSLMNSILSFTILRGKHTPEELASAFARLSEKTQLVLEDLTSTNQVSRQIEN